MRRFRVLFSAVVLAAAALLPAAASAEGNTTSPNHTPMHAGICTDMRVPVALAPGQPHTQAIAGTFCYPFKPDRSRAIDILVHGATYDRYYWDSNFQFPDYSYVNRTLQVGRAVFYYDRLGVGKSTQLPSTDANMYTDAYVLHQLIQRFGHAFHATNVIGHSFGSMITSLETSEYNDATRIVLTDHLHAAGPVLVHGEIKQYPANQDPQFAGKNLDNGWTTSVPGTRGVFYDLATADPNEIAYDDAHKAIFSSTELQQGLAINGTPAANNVTNKITRPVFVIVGQEDRLYCGLALDCSAAAHIKANEQPYFTSAASLTASVIPDTGHDLALHPSASISFAAINSWLEQ